MTELSRFKRRLTEVYVYPEICKRQDAVRDVAGYMRFLDSDPPLAGFMFYFHIPFCESLCWFCNYYKEVLRRDGYAGRRRLFDAYQREVESYSGRKYLAGRPVRAVQFGGGTPSAVEPEFVVQLLDSIRANFNCRFETVSLEGSVTSLQDREKLQRLREGGIRRISFGVQTFNENVRRKLHLKATIDDVYRTVEILRCFGFEDYSHDLMFNLPDQTIDDLLQDVDIVEKTVRPTYVDCYNLNVMPNTAFARALETLGYCQQPPSEEKEVAMMRALIRSCRERGLHQVASSVFSITRREPALTLQMALDGSDVVGIGPSARSFLKGHGYRNVPALEPYVDRVNRQGWGIVAGNVADAEELAERKLVMFGNLTFIRKSDIPNHDRFTAPLAFLLREGYAFDDGEYLRLTDEGKVWPGNVSELFFNERQRLRRGRVMLSAFQHGENPYNQDRMGISAAAYRRTPAPSKT